MFGDRAPLILTEHVYYFGGTRRKGTEMATYKAMAKKIKVPLQPFHLLTTLRPKGYKNFVGIANCVKNSVVMQMGSSATRHPRSILK